MEKGIPQLIHQIWSGIDEPLPDYFKCLGDTWKEHHPTWEYILWDNQKMNRFIQDNYPHYWDIYNGFQYNIQRWDAIRYLILNKMGGLYVDFDSECLKPLDELFEGKECCFSIEPDEHGKVFNKQLYFNNALMASVPDHPFMSEIVRYVFDLSQIEENTIPDSKIMTILKTTGPLKLVDLYENYSEKERIYLIPSAYTSPLTKEEVRSIIDGCESDELETKIENAYSIHYFFNGWVN